MVNQYKIPLKNKNKEIIDYSIVSEEDYLELNKYKWYISNNEYVEGKYNNKTISMHKFIMNIILNKDSKNKIVDHINSNKFDNRRDNLRIVTHSENARNRTKHKNSTSKYYGVSYVKVNNIWMSCIVFNNTRLQAYYKIEEHAAYQYDLWIKEYDIEYSNMNNIDKPKDFNLYEKNSKKNPELPIGISKNSNKYRVQINNKTYGYFDILEDAIKKLNEVKEQLKKEKDQIPEIIIQNENSDYIIEFYKKYIKINETIVDKEIYNNIKNYKISYNNKYATINVDNKLYRLHRYLLNCYDLDLCVDHINGNKLDNRLENLRIVTPQQNNMNKKSRENSTSQYIGVYLYNKKWKASIRVNNKNIHLGTFINEIDAAKARDLATKEYFGIYGKLNLN